MPIAVPIAGLTSVALAVGLKRLLARRRRSALEHVIDPQPDATPDDLRALHQTVAAQADETQIVDLHLALGALAVDLAARGNPTRPRLVRHAADCIEVLLDHPDTDPPPSWEADEGGMVWTLIEPPDPAEPLDGPVLPAPLLVTIGQPDDDDAEVYLDLEADGIVSLDGDVEAARNLARSILTEIALTPLADNLRLVTIGDLVEPDAAHLDHLRMAETWSDIAEDLIAWAEDSQRTLVQKSWANTFVGRGADPDHDALVPIAVIASKAPPPELLDALTATGPSAVAIVVADEFDGARTRITCEPDEIVFHDLHFSFIPQQLDHDELEAMGHLIVAASTPPPESDDVADAGDDQREGLELLEDDGTEGAKPPSPPEYDVLVRFLGEIRIDGGEDLQPKPTAVAAYLALHRDVTAERLEEACWHDSDGANHRKRLLEAMTQCRAVLGGIHFPANRDGHYRIGPRVRTDLELFDWHVAQAARVDPEAAATHYEQALALVTGRPFSYSNAARRSYTWVDCEHLAATWEARIDRVRTASSVPTAEG